MSQNQIRLDELTGRALDIRWFEGVALVQAVCRQVVSGGAHVFPPAREIVLTAAGTVSVGAGRSSGNPVQAAAHLLASMLGEDVPVRLRLVVTQATSPGEVYPTLADFSEAIAYFERPDASEVLANLFERASSAPQRAGDAVRSAEKAAAAEPEREDETPAGPRRRSRLAALAPVAGVAIVAAIWVAGSEQGTASLAGAATAVTMALERGWAAVGARPEAEPVEKATVSGPKRPAERAGRSRREARVPEPAVAASSRSIGPDRVARAVAAEDLSGLPKLVPIAREVWASEWAPARSPMVFFSRVEIAASSNRSPRVIDSSGPARGEPNGTRIYSHADSDVVLPRVVYPKLPDLPKGIRAEDLTILELVIGVDGLVERADLRSIPRDVHEFMLVSAAKAWQFAPATVDGQPVRFRYRIHLALQ